MRRILLSTVKILISAALLYFSLRKVDLHDLVARLHLGSLGSVSYTHLDVYKRQS